MRIIFFPTLLLFLFQTHFLSAQNGCPGCVVDLPPLPSDTIYLGDVPDGIAGELYDGDMGFRMPKTTDPVHEIDPGTPAGLNIGNITIIALLNVPPGLSWEANQSSFDPSNETDGCVKFCGTPVLPGDYEVQVFVTATVLTINQSTSFTFNFHVAPSASMTDGFGMQNSSGCGEVTVGFENNVLSNGSAGFNYFWDFGNGETSTDENPSDITYSIPGIYEVNYEAMVDTSGYELTTVQITAAGCNDFNLPPISNAPPELYIKIKDPSGTQIYQSGEITNAPMPSAFNVNIPIGMGDYTLEVRDNDLIGSDHCGTVTFNRLSTDTLVDGSLRALVNIFHPVFSIQSTDTVYVFEIPAPPVISPDGLVEVCEGGKWNCWPTIPKASNGTEIPLPFWVQPILLSWSVPMAATGWNTPRRRAVPPFRRWSFSMNCPIPRPHLLAKVATGWKSTIPTACRWIILCNGSSMAIPSPVPQRLPFAIPPMALTCSLS